jgi:hypothetical protein
LCPLPPFLFPVDGPLSAATSQQLPPHSTAQCSLNRLLRIHVGHVTIPPRLAIPFFVYFIIGSVISYQLSQSSRQPTCRLELGKDAPFASYTLQSQASNTPAGPSWPRHDDDVRGCREISGSCHAMRWCETCCWG